VPPRGAVRPSSRLVSRAEPNPESEEAARPATGAEVPQHQTVWFYPMTRLR
jgi:hypothetical protein